MLYLIASKFFCIFLQNITEKRNFLPYIGAIQLIFPLVAWSVLGSHLRLVRSFCCGKASTEGIS